jgi:peptidoglycan/LPS O-acetylase OafA/YrhL
VGVDVFFVLSGYLITSLILKDLEQGKFSLADFWERRVRRIFPALAAVTLTTLAASWFLLFPGRYRDLARSVIALVFGGSNFYFWLTTDYFALSAEEKPLLHTWSLAVEEQFYLLVPIFLLALAKTNRLHRALPLCSIAMVVSLGLAIYGVEQDRSATFYLLPSRAWELLAGTVLAIASLRGFKGPSRFGSGIAALGLTAILVPCVLYRETTPFPGLAAVPPVLGTVLLIWSGTQAGRLPLLNQLLAARPVVFIGLISYSLYLWHWPLFALVKSQSLQPLSVEWRWALVAASGLLAIASWRFIETPFRRRQVLAPRASLFRATSFASLSLLAIGAILTLYRGFENRLPPDARRYAAAARDDQRYRYQVKVKDIPDNLPVVGKVGASPSFLIWGDSHAMAILPALASLCEEKGMSVSVATHAGTPPVLDYIRESGQGLGKQTIPFNRAVFEYIQTHKPKAVVMAARWSLYFPDALFPAALQRTVRELRRSNVSVYVLNDFEFPYDVPKALALSAWRGWEFSHLELDATAHDAQRLASDAIFAKLLSEGVTILDPLPVLQARTGSSKILPYDAGGLFYRDRDHLSTYGALALKPLFAPLFSELSQRTAHRQAQHSAYFSIVSGRK